MFLDCHLEWRSLDPTLDICSNFLKKKSILPPFFSFASFPFKKDPTFHKNVSFLLHLVIGLVIGPVISPVMFLVIRPVICMVVRCFPICFNRFPQMDQFIIFSCSSRFDCPVHALNFFNPFENNQNILDFDMSNTLLYVAVIAFGNSYNSHSDFCDVRW